MFVLKNMYTFYAAHQMKLPKPYSPELILNALLVARSHSIETITNKTYAFQVQLLMLCYIAICLGSRLLVCHID